MKRIFFLILIVWSQIVLGQGGIPDRYLNDPAIDLMYKGNLLHPDEVHELKEKFKGNFDISALDPVEDSDLWKNTFNKNLPLDQIPVQELDEIKYHSPVLSPSGIFRFNIINNNDSRLYTVMISKTVHSVLMAKTLLRKIGYTIPDINYLPKVVVSFKDAQQKAGFVSYLENVAFAGSHKNWVIDELEDNKFVLQDVIIMPANNLIYNLAVGVTSDMIQGRRLFASLAVPLSIINLTESVNMLQWEAGIKREKEIILHHDALDQFQCSWDDARWIARRIEKLNRDDWKDIIESSHTPGAVQLILLEKILSRRNSVMKLFDIDHKEISINPEISSGVDLVKGKLTKQDWPGYGSRFSYGDPDSPLSASEINAFIKSKLISTGLDLALSQINQLGKFSTNVGKINEEEFEKKIQGLINKSVQQGFQEEMKFDSWSFPTYKGQFVFSRNIVTGTYLGTDNLVQLADTVGFALSAGRFLGTMGLPEYTNMFGLGEAVIGRTYAHLRPVTSIRKSLNYPFKNIFVPLVSSNYGNLLHEATLLVIDESASNEERAAKIETALKPFKETMNVGETILITDVVGITAGIKAGASYEKLIGLSLGLSGGGQILSRFHIHRKSEDEFQLYRDLGANGQIKLSFNMTSLVPVLDLGYQKSKGKAKVKFYTLNLNPKNPEALKNASYLRSAIVSSSTEELEKEDKTKPYIIEHSFKDTNPESNFLFWVWKWKKSFSSITVTNPKGDKKNFRRTYQGKTSGRNYQDYIYATIEHWVNLLFDKKAGFSEGGDNPGFSFKGKAFNRFLVLDEEVASDGTAKKPFVKITRLYNGWSINKDNANKVLESLKNRYRHVFFNGPVLNQTSRIFLYMISLNVLLYQQGITHLISLDEKEVRRIFKENKYQETLVYNPVNADGENIEANNFLRLIHKYKGHTTKKDFKKANKFLLSAISTAEENLNLNGILQLVGGPSNIFINSKIDGFREGDENGDKPIISSSLGEFGDSQLMGPLVSVQSDINALEGEFFAYWIMKRLL